MNVDRRALHGALKELVRVASGKASRPVLSHVLLETFDEKLTVTATDGTNTVDAEMPAEGPLSCCLPAKPLAALVKPEGKARGDVEIELEGDVAVIRVEGVTTRLATMPVESFPVAETREWSLVAMWPGQQVRDPLSYVLPAASRDDTRPHLNAVCFGPERIAATDGHRLHVVPLPGMLTEELLLRLDTAQVLHRLLDDDMLIVARAGDRIRLRTGAWQVDTRLVQAKFPPIDKVIPARDRTTRISMESALLQKALARVAKLAGDGSIRFVVNGVLTLQARDSELGEAEVVVPLHESNHVGDDVITGFRLAYLRDAVATKQQVIELGMDGPTDALRIDADDHVAVVMPMRL